MDKLFSSSSFLFVSAKGYCTISELNRCLFAKRFTVRKRRKKHEILYRNVLSANYRGKFYWFHLLSLTDGFFIQYKRERSKKNGMCHYLVCVLNFAILYISFQWSALKHVLWMMWRNKNQPKVYVCYFISFHLTSWSR